MAFAMSNGYLCTQVDGPEEVANLRAIFNGVVFWRPATMENCVEIP